ncbi:tetratricopeptide repeat protein [bacterium]|nr:tetratricopeptide repeat protein [bacterium]
MKRIMALTLISAKLVFAASGDAGFHPFQPDEMGGQFVGTRQDASQIPGSGMGPGLSLFFRYQLSPRILLDFSTGLATVTDDIFRAERAQSVMLPNINLRTNFLFLKNAKMSPFVYTGLMGAQVTRTDKLPDRREIETTFTDYGFMVGSGFIYKSYYNFSITMNADYRYALFSTGDVKSQYWVLETGVSFSMHRNQVEENVAVDFLLPDEENEVVIIEEAKPEPPAANNDFARFLYKVETLLDRIETKQKQLEDLELRVIANERAIAAVSGFVASEFVNYTNVISEDAPQEDAQDFMTIYQNALASYNSGLHKQAIRLFQQLLYMNKNHPLASNCQYWIGESHHAEGDYANAAAAFSSVLEYTLSSKYDDALLMNGICQLELGNYTKAKEYFSELVTDYPDSEYVARANDYLQTL